MSDSPDQTEGIRRTRLAEINCSVESMDASCERARLHSQYGQVWDNGQLAQDFEVLGFMAPYVVVRRKSDGRRGSLEFQHHPRFYFNLVNDH
jgi:hypothetical protein